MRAPDPPGSTVGLAPPPPQASLLATPDHHAQHTDAHTCRELPTGRCARSHKSTYQRGFAVRAPHPPGSLVGSTTSPGFAPDKHQ